MQSEAFDLVSRRASRMTQFFGGGWAEFACISWLFNFNLRSEVTVLHVSAGVIEEELIVVVAASRETAEQFLEDMIRINNEQTNLINDLSKKQAGNSGSFWR